MTPPATFSALADSGLDLQAVIDLASLPTDLHEDLATACEEVGVDLADYRRLVLLGQGGSALWDYIQASGIDDPDVFDRTATSLVADWVTTHHPTAGWKLIYPSDLPVPLVRLGEQAGWGSSSPLGISIHPDWGLWQAHRAAFLIDADLPATDTPPPVHPCDGCRGNPCEIACPAGAVSVTDGFDVEACGMLRIVVGSPCAYQCLSRNACPVGASHRYSDAQMRHHYAASLPTLRRWLGS